MSLSVGAISSYGQLALIKPLNYAISNQSRISDAYQTAVQSQGEIDLVNPVRYPNAKAEPADAVSRTTEAQKADQEFRAIAARYASSPAGYQADRSAVSYSMVGNGFDAIA